MKNIKLFLRIYYLLLIICFTSLFILFILGNQIRIGYLSDFIFNTDRTLELNSVNIEDINKLFTVDDKLNNDALTNYIFTNESITNYSYSFRIKYHNKIFRNSDIYDVYLDANKTIQDNNFIKEIKFNEKGSPFGVLISSAKLKYDEKIDNVHYKLKIKLSALLFLLSILFIYIFSTAVYKYKNYILKHKNKKDIFVVFIKKIKHFCVNYKKHIFISYSIIVILFVLFVIINSNIKHTSKLTDLELISESRLGYVYKSKIEDYKANKLFSIDNNSIQLNNTNDIKYYGYSLEITNKPLGSWHSTNIYYTENNTFIISNESTNENAYYYNIQVPTYIGDKYKITILAKQLPDNGIIKWHLNSLNNFKEIYDKELSNDYIVLTDVRDVTSQAGGILDLHFIIPQGVTEIKSILIESLNTNLYVENGYTVFTSIKKLIDYNINIDYKMKINRFILYIVIALVFIMIYMFLYLINKKLYIYIFFIMPILIYLVYLFSVSLNTIFGDEWELITYYDTIKNNKMNIIELLLYSFRQHNEHRMFFPKVLTVPILALTNWNTSIITYLSFMIYLIGCFIIIKYFYLKNNNKIDLNIIFIFVILFSIKQYENITWAFQIAWFMIFTLSVTSFYLFYLYTKENKNIYIMLSIVCGIISSFSSAQGLMIWLSFLILFILLILSGEIKKVNKSSFLILFIFGVIIFILYFYNYKKPVHHGNLFSGDLFKTLFIGISSSIDQNSILLGIILFLLSIYITIYIITKKRVYNNIFPLLILIFSYGFILSIVMSRAWAGIASRYITFTNLLTIALFILYFCNFKDVFIKHKKIVFILSIIILLNNSIPILNNLNYERNRKKEMMYVLRNYRHNSLDKLRLLYPFSNYDYAKKRINELEKYKFNVFSSKYDYLDDNLNKIGE